MLCSGVHRVCVDALRNARSSAHACVMTVWDADHLKGRGLPPALANQKDGISSRGRIGVATLAFIHQRRCGGPRNQGRGISLITTLEPGAYGKIVAVAVTRDKNAVPVGTRFLSVDPQRAA